MDVKDDLPPQGNGEPWTQVADPSFAMLASALCHLVACAFHLLACAVSRSFCRISGSASKGDISCSMAWHSAKAPLSAVFKHLKPELHVPPHGVQHLLVEAVLLLRMENRNSRSLYTTDVAALWPCALHANRQPRSGSSQYCRIVSNDLAKALSHDTGKEREKDSALQCLYYSAYTPFWLPWVPRLGRWVLTTVRGHLRHAAHDVTCQVLDGASTAFFCRFGSC